MIVTVYYICFLEQRCQMLQSQLLGCSSLENSANPTHSHNITPNVTLGDAVRILLWYTLMLSEYSVRNNWQQRLSLSTQDISPM